MPSQFELLKYAIKNSFVHRVDELKNIVVVPSVKGEELPQAETNVEKLSNGSKVSSTKATSKKTTLKGVRKTIRTKNP